MYQSHVPDDYRPLNQVYSMLSLYEAAVDVALKVK